jgi:starch phosphorylase
MLSPEQARIHAFEVVPSLPPALKPLLDIAYNLWWSWHPEAVELFTRMYPTLWAETNQNPVKMLGQVPQPLLDELSQDEGFLNAMDRVVQNHKRHMSRRSYVAGLDLGERTTIAYFCTEFGLTECFPIYSGGLGCLAGDHLKSAAELALPLVGIGLLYRNGYFQQYLNADGWQQEYYPDLDFSNLPVRPAMKNETERLRASVEMPGRTVHIQAWIAQVGRVRLFLLDTNLAENDPGDRHITGQLYGGDMDMRIRQEIVLGIGGVRILKEAGIDPVVCHMNEGHSAFLALERIRDRIAKHDLTFDQAREYARGSHVFTTHTPLPAGTDRLPPQMTQPYFKDYHS